MFIVQPDEVFGRLICEELQSRERGQTHWTAFEFAVAWVNKRGAETLKVSAEKFLSDLGAIEATVGVDFGSTSYEGLEALLDLEVEGASIRTHVFFDENPLCTFHPKVFLFSNAERARLFVGSSNLTGAGLSTNVEATLAITLETEDEIIQQTKAQLASWRDENRETKPQRLTREFLRELRANGYVSTECELRARRRANSQSGISNRKRLFGASQTTSPSLGDQTNIQARLDEGSGSADRREVLLMRVRPRRNGRQLQISMAVLAGRFMQKAQQVISVSDGSARKIGYDHVQRNGLKVPNLARFEAPEMERMQNPVARFSWAKVELGGSKVIWELQYELFDANSSEAGAQILETLTEGIGDPPSTKLGDLSQSETVLSKSDRKIAQWYRLAFL